MHDTDGTHDTHGTGDEGLDCAGDTYMISDRDLDALGEALLAWERWAALTRWWELGALDMDGSLAA